MASFAGFSLDTDFLFERVGITDNAKGKIMKRKLFEVAAHDVDENGLPEIKVIKLFDSFEGARLFMQSEHIRRIKANKRYPGFVHMKITEFVEV